MILDAKFSEQEENLNADFGVVKVVDLHGGCVKTVNGIAPDENGNVEVQGGSGGGGGGADGFSPVANVTQTASGAVISITDKSGTTTATIANGKDGKDGQDGYTPQKGIDYVDGKDGYTPQKNIDYFDGKDGKDGSNGIPATHSWNGTVLTVSSASGTSSANLKGEKGDKGDTVKGDDGISPTVAVSKSGKVTTISITDKNGTKTATINDGADGKTPVKGTDYVDGKDGTSVTVKSVSESTADGGSNVVTFSDGKTVTIKNGSKGGTGSAGKDAIVTMFISPDGNDSNDGLTASKPKKTVKACVSAGATRISAKRGTYAEQVALTNIDHLEIFPTDNNQEYSTDADWIPITFDLSETIPVSSLATYNSIKRVAYSNSANEQFDKVFTKKSQTPVVSDGYGSRYNATIWLLSNDEKTVCIKLKPVLTVAECEAESNTFTWVSGYIYINATLTGVEKVCVPTNFDSGFRIENAGKVILREVEVRFSGSYNVWLLNCPYFDFYKVSAKYSSYASGIDIDNANGTLTACYATKNYDGFGISGYGHTTYVDCVSEFNFDDGVSHHNGSCGTFIGGRYEGNGKGGNTPAYGAQVNIYGGLYKDNATFGVGYLYTSGKNPAGGMVQGAVMVGNPVGLNVDANCAVTAINCLYIDNTADKSVKGTLTEYNAPVSGGSGDSGDSGDTEPVNALHLAVNSDGSAYVGTNGEKGYKTGWRLNSSGVEKEQTGCCVSGFIPAKAGDIVRIENYTPNTAGYGYMFTYKSDFSKWGDAMNGTVMANNTVDGVLEVDISSQFDTSAASCAYIRFSCTEINENTVVTVTPKA